MVLKEKNILLLDTCGERASLALAIGDAVMAETVLGDRAASFGLLRAVDHLLVTAGVQRQQLSAVGVVNGPGSFTGLRIGLAVAKGLCVAADLPLAAVSRLAVLASAGALEQGLTVLRASRDEVYVREVGGAAAGSERMMPQCELMVFAKGRRLLCAEDSLSTLLGHQTTAMQLQLRARDALPLVQASLTAGVADLALLDANYVRNEGAIYRKQAQCP